MNYGFGSSSGSSGNGAKKNVYTVGGYPNPNIRSVSEVPPSSARSAMALADTLYNPRYKHVSTIIFVCMTIFFLSKNIFLLLVMSV